MAGIKKHIIGVTVISAGVCAALPFRSSTSDSPGPQSESSAAHDTNTNKQLRLNLSISAPQVIALKPEQEATTPQDKTSTNSAFHRPIEELEISDIRDDDVDVPPNVGSQFEPFVETSPVTIERQSPRVEVNVTHRIVDGDSLESLAERFLGNRDRWQEILDANTDTLASRDLLPIGEEIRILGTKSDTQEEAIREQTGDVASDLVPISAEALRASKKVTPAD